MRTVFFVFFTLLGGLCASAETAGKSFQGSFVINLKACRGSACETAQHSQDFKFYVGTNSGIYVYHDASGGRFSPFGKYSSYTHEGVRYRTKSGSGGNRVTLSVQQLDNKTAIHMAFTPTGRTCRLSASVSGFENVFPDPRGIKISSSARLISCRVSDGNIFK